MRKVLTKVSVGLVALALPLAAAVPATAAIVPSNSAPASVLPVNLPSLPSLPGGGGLPLPLPGLDLLGTPFQIVAQVLGLFDVLGGVGGLGGAGGLGLPATQNLLGGGLPGADALGSVTGLLGGVGDLTSVTGIVEGLLGLGALGLGGLGLGL